METAVALGVALHRVCDEITVLITCTARLLVFINPLCEVVIVNEIVAGVIRRVNVNHLDFAKICFAEHFQHIKVVTLDVEIFGCIEVH